ncbi:MAG TPA: leucyl aminopeptidase [Candidatus Krumholzibacteria bacterium]|nr:leucyl aminopeptidase [Candidatus Krumholzibacteria bacterium]HPD71140.1 leucyl aminopeptidase [Candidatus Krumholzibacteria bacterium]HRY39160.1 leucyl aminopeptidase [Candidatus Krumholzibacteria bacterium]
MRWSVVKSGVARTGGDLLILPVVEGDLAAVQRLTGGRDDLAAIVERAGFRGAAASTLPVFCAGPATGWILLVGLGKPDRISLETVRKAAGTAAQQARSMRARTVVVAPLAAETGLDAETVARCWVEGFEMGLAPAGTADARRSATHGPLVGKVVAERERDREALRRGVSQGEVAAAGCLEARRLVNLPPNQLTPQLLAEAARGIAKRSGYRCTVLGPAQLRTLKMGGLLGVGQGSRNAPRLISLESRGAPRGAPTVALVGKGVTFDSGGISLKPGAKMEVMKCDMAGAAAVLGAAVIVAARRLPVRLLVVVPTAENMPDGGAIKPSDVLTMASGTTVEVLNTDAEGRLILADALHWTCRRRPDYLIDAATLTGACVIALGQDFAGLLGNSSELVAVLEQAGGETGERVWPLPLVDAHREALQSKVADLKNLGPREGGALTAAAFLSQFVPEDIAWAHVDLAGPAWTDKGGPLGPRGGTGFGARLLARAVEILVG